MRLGAEQRVAKKGVYWLVERRFPLASRHGAEVLATAFERAIPLRQRERRPGGRVAVHPDEAVFLDVETTGLAGGTGTLAFLASLERAAAEMRLSLEASEAIYRARHYILDRGAARKPLLESVALLIPTA